MSTYHSDFNIPGAAARAITVDRNPAAGTGKNLTVEAGGAKSGETNTAGGDLVLLNGKGTGNPSSHSIKLSTYRGTGSGATDQTATVAIYIAATTNTRVVIGNAASNAADRNDGINFMPEIAQTIYHARRTTADTAGNILTVKSGGATSGATNKAAGNLVLATGISTGNGAGAIALQTTGNVAASTTDNTLTTRMTVDVTDADFSVPVVPTSSDGAALGTTSLMWSDLFLASGGVINFNNGNMTLTHAAGQLTLAGGPLVLAENSSIALDPAGSADGKYSGTTVTGTGGDTIAFGDLVTLDKDDSRWEKVDISVAAAATGDARGIIGIAATSSTDGAAITVLLNGIIRADANFPALTIGAPVYASTTGDIVVAQPTTTDHVIRIIGYALTADEIYFSPGNSWTTHT